MKRADMQIDILPPIRHNGFVVLQANVQGHPRRRKRNGTLYFEIPERWQESLVVRGRTDDLHDAFVRAILFSAMEAERNLIVRGCVSASLLRNLEAYQRMVADWWPAYHAVEIHAEHVVEDDDPIDAGGNSKMLLAFSGGLDSAYSLDRHNGPGTAKDGKDIAACLFVHGFDIPPDDASYAAAYRAADRIAAERGAELIPVRSNLKQRLPYWPQAHGAALAAALSLFGRQWSTGLIAPSVSRDNPFLAAAGYGSTSTSDPLLSSASFRIVHDPTGKTRVEKSEMLRSWPTCLRSLRVCWEGKDLSGNCGGCSKCLWQMLCLRAVGINDLSGFRGRLSPRRVARLNIADPAHLFEYEACYEYARRHGRAGQPEFVALGCAIASSRQTLRDEAISGLQRQAAPREKGWFRVLPFLRRGTNAATS
ncbi:MAG: hypothetical protein JJ992_28285 [Planctomycetes bacterium]|nr:hypothetical protein [Planctomycetota bacterium]